MATALVAVAGTLSCPYELSPQPTTEPLASNASVLKSPAVTATTFVSPAGTLV